MKKILVSLLILTLFLPSTFINGEEVDTKDTITISIVGDVLMDGYVRSQINKNGYGYPWEKVKDYFHEDNLTIANLETSITTRGKKWPNKQFNFRSHPQNFKYMKESGIDVITIANNHILDYSDQGFLDTLDHLEKNQIPYAGGGRNRKEALQGITIEVEDLKIGILAFSRVIPDVKWYATDKRAGIVGAYDGYTQDMMKRIKEMKEETDIIVLSIHWGVERSTEPRKQEMNLAKAAIDAGVDVVMGHHPHVLQGIEIYSGKPIFYSLGNFVFGGRDKMTRTTMVGQINIRDRKVDSVKIIPCNIVNGRPIPVEGMEKDEAINYINSLSKAFKVSFDKDGIMNLMRDKI